MKIVLVLALTAACASAPAPRSSHMGVVPFESVFMLADPPATLPESTPDGDYRVDARVCSSTSGTTTAVIFLAPSRGDLREAILKATSRWKHRQYLRDDEKPARFCYDARFYFSVRDGHEEARGVTEAVVNR